ncbi:MAG: UV DNA damage repair endonuclease UvsE, partial [Flavobacteriales bacterium]|nr:UV DNA damage repair endonuclease UvsE [Flavobacteriales bacterium]
RITTNRSMIKRTYKAKGVKYASALSLLNVQDLERIIDWNEANDIKFYRMSSDIFPWASEHGIDNLPDYDQICEVLKRCGDKATAYGQRLTTHPGPFNKLTSPREQVVLNTIKDLEIHGQLFDLMGLPRTPYAKINIHVGAHYNDKSLALGNFCRNFDRLSDSVQRRLTVENDDKASLYSTKELCEEVYSRIGIPVVHDFHHHTFCTGEVDQEEALTMAAMTWGDVTPVTHYSQSRSVEHNDPKIKPQAHSDSYWEPVNTYGLPVDVMLECKHKEIGLYKMQELLQEQGKKAA